MKTEEIEICCEVVIDWLLDDTDYSTYSIISDIPILKKMNDTLLMYTGDVSMLEFTYYLNGGNSPWGEERSAKSWFSNREECIPFFSKFMRNKNIKELLRI